MYKTLKDMHKSTKQIKLDDTMIASNICNEYEKPIVTKYLESMFFNPLSVPEQGKVIQAQSAAMGR